MDIPILILLRSRTNLLKLHLDLDRKEILEAITKEVDMGTKEDIKEEEVRVMAIEERKERTSERMEEGATNFSKDQVKLKFKQQSLKYSCTLIISKYHSSHQEV